MVFSLLLCLVLQCTVMANLVTSAPSVQEIIDEIEVNIRDESLEEVEEIIKEEVLYNLIQPATSPELAAASCKEIAVDTGYESGYYWVQGASGPTGVYCDLTGSRFGQKGGWMRVAAVNDTSNSYCFPGLKFVTEPTKACAQPQTGQRCSSKVLPVHGIEYSTVCGRLLASQEGTTDGFWTGNVDEDNINGIYFDGVSITHGNPRKHIWSFGGVASSANSNCPCYSNINGVPASPFVGADYFCESGATSLWDGKGCSSNDKCCQRGGPWFCKGLPEPTTDDIELRICATGSDEKFYVEEIEMYVQ